MTSLSKDVATGGSGGPMVRAEGVHKSFGLAHILKGIDLEVNPREVFCLIGPSGSGKSTFLRCINHLEKISAGRLYVDGDLVGYRQKGDKLYELKESEVAAQRRDIGMVFQRFNLFPHMSAWATARATTRPSSPAVSSSAWPSRAPWRCSRS
jgi:polar amino acid transport system ATP-binding protein